MIANLQKEVELVSRHLQILRCVIDDQPIGIENLADETDYPFHKVRYSLRVLEDADLVRPTNRGAVTTDDTADYLVEFNDRLDGFADRVEELKEVGTTARPAD